MTKLYRYGNLVINLKHVYLIMLRENSLHFSISRDFYKEVKDKKHPNVEFLSDYGGSVLNIQFETKAHAENELDRIQRLTKYE